MPFTLVPVIRSVFRGRERKRRQMKEKEGRLKRNSDARGVRSHRSFTVMDVGCERHDKKMDNCVGFPPQKGQRGLVINPILSQHERRELQ